MKLPRDISGNEVIQALRRLGFVFVRQTGSHVRMARGTLHVTVPVHREIAPKTLQSILRQAGVSLQDFIEVV